MRLKQIVILGIIFCAFLAGVVVKKMQQPPELATQEYVSLDLALNQDNVEKILIHKGSLTEENKGIRLVRGNSGWNIDSLWNAAADEKKINQLLQEIGNTRGELRAKDTKLFPDFGLKDEEAYHLVLTGKNEKVLLHLLLGTKKADSGSLFIRRFDSDQVFLSEANLFGYIGIYGEPKDEELQNDYWASLDFLKPLDSANITRIETVRFENGQGTVTASAAYESDPADPAKKEWKFQQEGILFPAGGEEIKQFVDELKTLRAQQVVDPAEEAKIMEKPVWRMSVWAGDNEPAVVTAGKMDETSRTYPVKVSGQPVLFKVSEYYFQKMDVDDSRFIAANPLSITPDKVQKVVIHSDGKDLSFEPAGKPSDKLKAYLEGLQTFKVQDFISDPEKKKQAKSPGDRWIEIQSEGLPPQILDVSGNYDKDLAKYPAVLRGSSHAFMISSDDWQKLFSNLKNLEEK